MPEFAWGWSDERLERRPLAAWERSGTRPERFLPTARDTGDTGDTRGVGLPGLRRLGDGPGPERIQGLPSRRP